MEENQIKKLVAASELKNYFIEVRRLHKEKSEKFPVNLNEVWPLAYSRKDAAVRELRKKFKTPEDYIIDSVSVNTPNGGATKMAEIKLSVECLEHFIAAKVPEVFEVYRKVFHQAVDEQEILVAIPNFKNPAEAARAWAHQYELKELAQSKVKELKPLADYASDVLKAKGSYTMMDLAKMLGFTSGMQLAQKLYSAGVLHKYAAPYKLRAKYSKKKDKLVEYGTKLASGKKYTSTTMTWTEEGRKLVTELYKKGKLD